MQHERIDAPHGRRGSRNSECSAVAGKYVLRNRCASVVRRVSVGPFFTYSLFPLSRIRGSYLSFLRCFLSERGEAALPGGRVNIFSSGVFPFKEEQGGEGSRRFGY